jgi:hypothetical protein
MDLTKDSRTRLFLLCLLVVLAVWVVGFAFDRILAHDGVTRTEILVTSNALTGLVAGGLFYTLALNERMRRNQMRDRLRTVAEMNHHIRNALQVITYAAEVGKNDASVEMIRQSVDRIEWTLREVLPGPNLAEVEATPASRERVRA